MTDAMLMHSPFSGMAVRATDLAAPTEPAASLTVCISTIGARALRLCRTGLPARTGVSYMLLVQEADARIRAHMSELCREEDITWVETAGRGVAHSRNLALELAPGELLLFADDDMELLVDSYPRLQAAFAREPNLACICGMVLNENGDPRKRYGRHRARLRPWNIARVGTPEIALRAAHVRALGLRFDEGFGAGTGRPIGDEFIFLADALRAGMKGRHLSVPLAVHPQESSGMAFDGRSLEHRRAALRRALGRRYWPFALAFTIKNRRQFGSVSHAWRFLCN